MPAEPLHTRVETGRVAFVDPTTLVYVPHRATIEDVRGALLQLHRTGLTRPVPGSTTARERVYPIEYCPSEDRDVWYVFLRNDRAELIEGTLHVRQARELASPGPPANNERPDYVDPFACE